MELLHFKCANINTPIHHPLSRRSRIVALTHTATERRGYNRANAVSSRLTPHASSLVERETESRITHSDSLECASSISKTLLQSK